MRARTRNYWLVLALLLPMVKCLELPHVKESVKEANVSRPKRQLTTICVEIKPIGPKEEPYYMCKGTHFPTFPLASGSAGDYSNKAYNTGTNAYGYHPPPTVAPTHVYNAGTNGAQSYPYPVTPTPPQPFRGPAAYPPQQNVYQYEKPTAAPKYEQTTTATGTLSGYESVYNTPSPTYAPQHAPGYSGYTPSHMQTSPPTSAPYSPASYETQPAGAGGAYASAPAYDSYARQGPSNYNQHAPPTAHVHAPAAVAAPTAKPAKSTAAEAVPYTSEILATPAAYRGTTASAEHPSIHTNTQATRPIHPALVAAAMATPSTDASVSTRYRVAPTEGASFDGAPARYGGAYQLPAAYKYRVAAARRRLAHAQRWPLPPASFAAPVEDRYRSLTSKEEIFGIPDWGFTPEELDLLPTNKLSDAQQLLGAPQSTLSRIPPEHWDDPVMQVFYESLLEPLPPTLSAKAVDYHLPQLAASAIQTTTPKTPTQCAEHVPTTARDATVGQQSFAASDTAPAVVYNCGAACASRSPCVQPVFIALPCYGPSAGHIPPVDTSVNYVPAATQQHSSAYNHVGMAAPGLGFGLFGRPLGGLFNMGLNPFFRPFGLLGIPQAHPQAQAQQQQQQQQQFAPNQNLGMANNMVGAANANAATEPKKIQIIPVQHDTVAPPIVGATHLTTHQPIWQATPPNGFNFNAFISTLMPTVAPESSITTESSEFSSLESGEDKHTSGGRMASDEYADIFENKHEGEKVSSTLRTAITTTATPIDNSSEHSKAIEEVPSHLEEESRKAYKSLMNAAKNFSQGAKTEAGTLDDGATGRVTKRQNVKTGVIVNTNNNYKRKYVQKL